jgi:hypothetical protein
LFLSLRKAKNIQDLIVLLLTTLFLGSTRERVKNSLKKTKVRSFDSKVNKKKKEGRDWCL